MLLSGIQMPQSGIIFEKIMSIQARPAENVSKHLDTLPVALYGPEYWFRALPSPNDEIGGVYLRAVPPKGGTALSLPGYCPKLAVWSKWRWKIFAKIPPRPKFDEESESGVIFDVTSKENAQKN